MSRAGVVAAVVAGAAAGAAAGFATFQVMTGPTQGDRRYGSWTTVEGVGQARQDAYTRARVARFGIWGLPSTEVVYFSGDRDSRGAPLRRRCTYAIHGGALPARWWSVTLYRDGFFIANPANRYSWSNTDVTLSPSGAWTLTLAPAGEGRNRLTFGAEDGRFELSLRLYQPKPGVAAHRADIPLPTIERLGCAAGDT